LTKSISPQVYGHDDVKRAVLLMLFGGVHKETKEVIHCSLHADKGVNLEQCAVSEVNKSLFSCR